MTNNENVVKLLQNRSYGGVKSKTCSRQTKVSLGLSILKHLVSNKSKREYTEITRISTQGLVHYSNGKLFVKNSVTKKIDCYCVLNNVNIIRKLWSIPAVPRWEDQAIIRDPEHIDYQNPQLLVLRSDSTLEEYNLKTGVLRKIFRLYKNLKFTELSEEIEMNRIFLKSVKSNKRTEDILLRIIIFEYSPLRCKEHWEIKRSMFGSDTSDVSVMNSILLVQGGKGSVRLYSLQGVKKDVTRVEYSESEGFLPNVKVRDLGPCLFHVNSENHFLHINEKPWIYIKETSGRRYSIESLVDNQPCGLIHSRSNIDVDDVTFFQDGSGRVLQYGGSTVLIHKLDILSRLSPELKLEFEECKTPEISVPGFTRSGRRISKSNYTQDEIGSVMYTAVDFEDELDMFGVLAYTETEIISESSSTSTDTHLKELRLYDSRSLTEIRTLTLDILHTRSLMDSSPQTWFTLDLDILIIKVKSSGKTSVYILQLSSSN